MMRLQRLRVDKLKSNVERHPRRSRTVRSAAK